MRSILSLEDRPSEIGVFYGTLRSWINQDEIDSGKREGLTTQEKEELQRLRREVKTLRQEKEILRKADCTSPTANCSGIGLPHTIAHGRLLETAARAAKEHRYARNSKEKGTWPNRSAIRYRSGP